MKQLTIVIATYNSEKRLLQVFETLSLQSLAREKYEVIVVDGGSNDNTKGVAKKFGARVIDNPRVEPVYAKYLGLNAAKTRYIMYLDHDEVIQSKDSLKNKVAVLEKGESYAVAGGNYVSPSNYHFINDYINDFGDPFSYFVYRLSKRNVFFEASMREKYPVKLEDGYHIVFDLADTTPSIFEMVAGASMFNLDALKKHYPEVLKDPNLITHIYYYLHKLLPTIVLMKNDPIMHFSSETIHGYLKKISWRIKNNIYFVDSLGASGFSGRNKIVDDNEVTLLTYFYIPYALTLVFPFLNSLDLILSRRNISYMVHFPLTLYTALTICYHLTLKQLGYKPRLTNYDNTKIIDEKN